MLPMLLLFALNRSILEICKAHIEWVRLQNACCCGLDIFYLNIMGLSRYFVGRFEFMKTMPQ